MVSARRPHRQFDVFRNPDRTTAAEHPFLIVLQSDAVDQIDTRVVAPLVSPRQLKFFEKLLPRVMVEGAQYVIAIPAMAAIPTSIIGSAVVNLESEGHRITGAIDLLFLGI
ncbi:MAG TPA: CcdB family protein [Rhizomicrobium sp.]|jgi:toxin CcdB|nr:CcdB family protein [Rhizomicrobium sp.]